VGNTSKLLEVQTSIGGQMKIGDTVYDRDLELVGVVLDIDDNTGLIWVQFAYKLQTERTMKIGDLCWDIVTETMWIISDIWFCSITDEYKYDLTCVKSCTIIVTNDYVATYMRADFLKRTKNVLDKSEE
jgi:hypothetical protein